MDYSYESEHTKFIRELIEKDPKLEDKRLEARNIWWDKKLDKEEQKRFDASDDPMKPYVYFGG
ncbi:MAG: DUF3460 family protein [Nitrosomonas sp.]|nr:DUF3460 family protein [Nitrosomonas sp.]